MTATDEQRGAVSRRDGPLFVSAAAGSGKTRVLVERFVATVLDDDVAVERILAITFTEKAAGELAARVRRALIAAGERERARALERGWISTIHGFCARLLRADALAAGLDPEFRVLDEVAAARLAVDAFDRALGDFLETAQREALDLAASYTPERLERMVRAVHGRLRTRGETRPSLPAIDAPALGDERDALEREVRAELAAGAGDDAARARLEALAEALARVPADAAGDFELFARLEPAGGELERAYLAWLDVCRAHKAHADYELLGRLVESFGRHYAELKQAQSSLDFEDLELSARDLLRDQPALRADLRRRFAHVLVDEFQDVNPLQDELIELVSDGNLFAVGDERQSIYGFRGADVGVFRRHRDEAAQSGRSVELTTSFRSRPELLNTVADAFEAVFGPSYVRPRSGREERSTEPPVELVVVDRSKARWEERLGAAPFGETFDDVPAWRAAEARLLALRVDELTSGDYRPGDIAVLVRAATDVDVYERALEERGIPTYALGGSGYWGIREIGDLRAYLAALANPRDEQSLYNVLASPLVGCSLDSLTAIHRHARANGRRDIWWALEAAFCDGDDDGLADRLVERARIESFVRGFAAERRGAPRRSLETLIDRAITRSGYDSSLLALPDGTRRMANVRKLMRLAREFESDQGRDLRAFIDLIDEQQLLAVREAEAPLEAEGLDAVRLMTIHAAKGLEFPVVCVADLGRAGRGDDVRLAVSSDGRAGLEVASLAGRRAAALELVAIRAEEERMAEAEERRIFYVALTRARDHLIVSGATDAERWPEPKPLGAPIEWLWRALAPQARALFEGTAEGVVEGADTRVRCRLVTPDTVDELLPAPDRAPAARQGVPEPVLAEPLSADGAPGPAAAPITRLPVARLSYSALESYRRCGYRFYLERVVRVRGRGAAPPGPRPDEPQLSLGEAGAAPEIAALVRGTIVHQLLESVDFARRATPSLARVRERALANGVEASEAALEQLRMLVAGFLATPLAARLEGARRELPFAFELDPPGSGGQRLLVGGVVDALAEQGDEVLIVDYKTDPLEGAAPETFCAEHYSTQRVVYALAGLRTGARAVEVVHCFLERPEAPVTASFGQGDAATLEGELLALAGDLIAGRFEPTASPHRELCQDCPGQPALCVWGPERTLAVEPPKAPAARA